MKLCNDGHEEICYEERNCPACELLKENEELEKEIESLKDEIKSMKEA
jgi:predicted nuclease with TOPRIM domain